jgi:hypothetical protein
MLPYRCCECGTDLEKALNRIEITEVALKSTTKYLRYMACNKVCLTAWLTA